jgi:hypothetical protein
MVPGGCFYRQPEQLLLLLPLHLLLLHLLHFLLHLQWWECSRYG